MDLVVNASPLILLCKAGYVHLLEQLSDTCVIPVGVELEICAQSDDEACHALPGLSWLKRESVTIPESIKPWDLGRGESEVLAYALLNQGYRPLLDDAEGKACALAHGLQPIGTGGLLVLAKRHGLIDEVAPALTAIRAKGLWISANVFDIILKSAGEEV